MASNPIVIATDLCYKGHGHKAVTCDFELGMSTMKRGQNEPALVKCDRRSERTIVSLPADDLPLCPNPDYEGMRMVIEKLIDED